MLPRQIDHVLHERDEWVVFHGEGQIREIEQLLGTARKPGPPRQQEPVHGGRAELVTVLDVQLVHERRVLGVAVRQDPSALCVGEVRVDRLAKRRVIDLREDRLQRHTEAVSIGGDALVPGLVKQLVEGVQPGRLVGIDVRERRRELVVAELRGGEVLEGPPELAAIIRVVEGVRTLDVERGAAVVVVEIVRVLCAPQIIDRIVLAHGAEVVGVGEVAVS